MLKSESSKSKLKSRSGHAGVSALCLLFGVLILIPAAFGQDFTLQMDPFPPPDAIDPGGITATNITLAALNGFNGTVDLTCQITSQPAAPTPPTCQVSPSSVKPAGGASVTVTSIGSTTPTIYSVTVTGTATGAPTHTQSQNLTVLAVSPQFTITIGASIVPSS